ncbi:unnamed protein product [Zymoseptoria tritici ST99CH_3D1]|nr:unnamed protein product [Zymoseptoria tritici ST99CH_3D1]
MAPSASKRKRPERQPSEDDGSGRPSPYKPEKSRSAAQQGKKSSRRKSADAADADGMEDTADNSAANTPAPESGDAAQTTSSDAAMPVNGSGQESAETSHYRYIHLTDEVLSTWEDSGKQAVLNAASGSDEMDISDVLLELIRSVLDGKMDSKQSGSAVRDIIAAQDSSHGVDVVALFINNLSFLYEANYKGPGLGNLVAATGIDQQLLRQELDIPILVDLGLVRSTFEKMRTRKTTNALYRQANFNLLREESEGYSKLVTEYFNTAQEASSRREEDPLMAEDAFRRVKALVGAFDLDVGRVLDITLDVSANLLVKAYPFFIKFYRASSWWPSSELLDNIKWEDQGFASLPEWALPGSGKSVLNDEEKAQLSTLRQARDVKFWQRVRDVGMNAFFELGMRKIVDFDSVAHLLENEAQPELDSRGKENNPHKRQRLNEDRKFMRETGSLPPPGNYDAAQLLGFKMRYYASDARDASDVVPENLVWLVALLIKIGFISLRDLYPHLHPSDEDMPKERSRLEKEKAEQDAKEKPGGGMNALLMAGALPDEAAPATRGSRIDKEKNGGGTPAQEKKEEASEELPTPKNQKVMLLRALLLIGAIPEALFMLGRFPWLADVDVSLPPVLHRIARHMLSKVAEELKPLGAREGFQEPREQLFDTTANPDGSLMFSSRPPRKTTRWLYNDCFNKEDGLEYKHYYGDWSDNIPVCQNLDDVFSLCDTFLGYLGVKIGQDVALYGTLLRLAQRNLTEDTSDANRARWLDLMKRLLVPALSTSKHNPQLAQQVFDLLKLYPTATRYNVYAEWFTGKTSRLPEMRVAFDRNKAEVRDVLRRVSNDTGKKQARALGKVSLASPGIVMSEMINQLESYSNMIPSLVECTRHFSNLAYDVLTWSMINSLSGQGRNRMQADGMLTSSWLQALSQFVASLFARYSHLNPSPVLQYLASELRVGNSTDLEMFEQVLVEMAGIRSDVEFNDNQVLAMAGGELLQSHIMRQLSDTRHTKTAPAKRLIKALADPGLVGQTLIAIAQERHMYSHHEDARFMPLKVLGNNLDKIQAVFAQYLDVLKTNLNPKDFEAAVPDASTLVREFGLGPGVALSICRFALRSRMAEFDANKKLEDKKDKTTTDTNGDAAMKDAVDEEATEGIDEAPATPAATQTSASSHWHPVLEPVIQDLSETSPELATRVSLPFFVTFWTLTSGDVLVPIDSYHKEVERLEQKIKDIQNDRSDVSAIAARERDRNRKNLQEWHDKLKQEPAQHLAAYMIVRKRISKGENLHWFPKNLQESKADKDAKHLGLLQECFLPRAMMSSVDAHFSYLMLKIMHDNATPGFSLMHLLHQLFKKNELASIMFQCTANESQHFGRFLSEILRLLHRWHVEKAIYEKEALGDKTKLRGFVITFDESGEPKTVLEYENFRRMLYNFHSYINGALQSCFQSGEYMHIRNGINVLKGIVQTFPALKFMGKNMVDLVKLVSTTDTRSDLKLAAMSLLGPLKTREKLWVLPQAFRMNDPAKDGAKSGTGSEPPNLNAAAPEFKPLTNGSVRKQSEDGEIADEKLAKTKAVDTEMKDSASTETETPKTKAAKEPPKSSLPSKASTPTSAQSKPPPAANVPQRPEPARQSSNRAAGRQPLHDLPSRPEPGPPKAPTASAPPRPDTRFPARPEERFGRLDRPAPDGRPDPRDQTPPGQRGRGRTPPPGARGGYRDDRSYERGPHDHRSGREETWGPPRRESQMPPGRPHDSHDRSDYDGRRSQDVRPDRMSVASSVSVPPESQQSSRAPASASRNTPTQPPPQDAGHGVHPGRMALINADSPSGTRSPRNARETDTGRMDERGGTSRSDNRADRRAPAEPVREPLPQQQDVAPIGPKRGLRPSRDMGPPPQSESNYGRLNAADPPSGPRQANGSTRGGRNFTAPLPTTRGNESQVSLASPARVPDSPATHRGGSSRQSTGAAPLAERQPAHASTPSTPINENGPAVHPSRAAILGQQGPPAQIQTNLPAPNGPRNASSPSAPSGPRGPAARGPPTGTPTGPSPTTNAPPSGPASAAERQRRGQDRQRATINNALAGGGGPAGQGVNFRGASSRQPSVSGPPGPGSRGPSTPMEPPQGRGPFDSQTPATQPNGRPDLFQSKSDRTEDPGMRRREDDWQDRSRGSRNPSRERRPDNNDGPFRPGQQPPPPPPGPPPPADDRRGGPRDERRRDDRPSRDARPPRDIRGPRAEDGPPRRPPPDGPGASFGAPPPDWERGTQRRDAPDESRRGGRPPGPGREDFRGGPPGPRRGEEPRGPPRDEGGGGGPPADGRKRRHEDVPPFDGSGPKRRRSGR